MTAAPTETQKQGFNGLTVASFESRMAAEMEALIVRQGGRALMAPSMREVPIEANQPAFDFFDKLQKKEYDLVILLTGVGTRALFKILESRHPQEDVLKAFAGTPLVARGPKPVKALSDVGLKPLLVAPEPNTWRELLQTLDAQRPAKGLRVAVQEYGIPNPELLQGLRDRGAQEVSVVPVYQWDLPLDLQPLKKTIQEIIGDRVQVALFTSSPQIRHLFQVAQGMGLEEQLRSAFQKVVVASVGPLVTETLEAHGLKADLEPEHPKMGFLVKEAAEKSAQLLEQKRLVRMEPLSAAKPTSGLSQSLFLKACRKEPVTRTPLWIMRQAGRYLPEYREVRSKVSFLELCKTPELAAEVTVKAQQVLGVDAAILFADILLIAEPLGLGLQFAESGGPSLSNPIRSASDIENLGNVDPASDLGYVLKAVQLIRKGLDPDIPLIGFAGAPFTLASYLIEGGGSKHYIHTKSLLNDAKSWDALMQKLVPATAAYLNAQAASGTQALQLFDSWVGILSPEQFQTRVLPYLKDLISRLTLGIPVIYFGTQTAPFFPYLKGTGATVIGVDGRTPLDEAWKQLGDVAVQGNLDPEVLLTDPENVHKEAERILKSVAGRPGHIFNLGHGILPNTPMENVRAMIETVKDHLP